MINVKSFIISGVVSLIVAILSFVITNLIKENSKLKKERDNTEKTIFSSLQNGVKCLLRSQLMLHHDEYMQKGSMTANDYENWTHMYDAYKGLGGNGMITKMADDIEQLPIDKEK